MAKDLDEAIGTALGQAAREAAQQAASNARKRARNGSLSGAKGVAAGIGIAALVPFAVKGAGKVARGARESIGKGGKAGGVAGRAKRAATSILPGAIAGNGGGESDLTGVGQGRRMPIQQGIDVAVPISTAYNQWTQFEDWPNFMHRLESVSQEDESHVIFKTKIWGISKEFEAEIVDQRPDERIKWKVTEGVAHTGVVTFHELSDRLTRIEVSLDVEPASLIEKAGRGARHVKRAVRADLARFKAYIEMHQEETGAWRGVIDDGKVKRRKRSSSRSRGSSSSASKSRGGSSSGKSKSTSSRGRSKSASTRSKASSSGSRSRSASSRSKSSSSGSKSSSSGSKSSSSRTKSSSSRSKKSGTRS